MTQETVHHKNILKRHLIYEQSTVAQEKILWQTEYPIETICYTEVWHVWKTKDKEHKSRAAGFPKLLR